MKLYISGPMTGLPSFNFPQFDHATAALRAQGYDIVSPAEHDRAVVKAAGKYVRIENVPGYAEGDVQKYTDAVGTLHDFLVWDFAQIAACDGIALLPNWEHSSGARAERFVAESLHKEVFLVLRDEGTDWYAKHDTDQQMLPALVQWAVAPPVTRHASELNEADIRTIAGEVRVVDPNTGGEKGSKLARFDLLPYDALHAVSEHFGRGAAKYEARNWERGYTWSLSYAAMQRHLAAWWQGETNDEEFGWSHLRAVVFHALALLTFELRGAGTDDRPQS